MDEDKSSVAYKERTHAGGQRIPDAIPWVLDDVVDCEGITPPTYTSKYGHPQVLCDGILKVDDIGVVASQLSP